MLGKICAMFLFWIIIGFVGFWWKVIAFDVKVYRIDPDRGDELISEAVKTLSSGMLNVDHKEFGTRKSRRELRNHILNNAVIASWVRSWITWPKTFAEMDQGFGEVYAFLKNKYARPIEEKDTLS